ncbi:DUF433 domain-containing protein [Bythopirellula polymerisocia]|uniref:DUF433 domain-containing protein n=1 Tax=Bythopirellula polymerisocia TaxID=2528003 RepID=A0A5C6CRR2_9BACT|nr:DUF433 domain-containing protein [Bythopirellula polymerisocia]TWU25806.1 hypothetical protein Pla144_30180 [Bythopirellula polymerisocia]
MPLPIQADLPPLCESQDGVVRIAGTRIPLERVVRAFCAGATPEQIAQDFDVLSLEVVYAVINYYLHHRQEVDAYLATADEEAAERKAISQERFDPTGVRARLLAKRDGA